MELEKSLDFLALADDFKVEKSSGAIEDNWLYKVSEKFGDLCAFFETDGMIRYYVSGVYNNCIDYREIDVDKLNKLVKFCNYLVEQSKK